MDSQLRKSFHELESLPPRDRELFSTFGRGKTAQVPFTVIHHAFESMADQHESVVAVKHYDGTTITYGELERRANILANELCTKYNVRKGDRVLLVYSRSIEMVVFILAVLKAGGQYIPLDGGIVPNESLGHNIIDSRTSLILCLPKFREKVEQSIPEAAKGNVRIVSLDSTSDLWTNGNENYVPVNVGPEDGAYIIYTSGTTGKSKGVDVTHGNVTNALLTEPANLGITVGRKVAQQLNVGFDMCKFSQDIY
jgi:acyl-CoA synthetase (AMP-forming)/AMP-acid ligase II